MSKLRSTRKSLGLVTAGLTLLGSAALAAVPVAASGAAAPAVVPTQYVKAVPVCAVKPAKGHAACFAMRRVVVSSTTPGAHALARPAYAVGPAGGYTPADLATAYGVNASAATTITVGIVDAFDDPKALSDLNVFDAKYGLPAETGASFKKVSQSGSTTVFPTPDAGWAGEISLDVDAVRGLCHGCKIVLVEANSNSFADLAAAENQAVAQGAKIITNSYGGAESGAIPASIVSAYTHPGVVITASTGDHGMYDWDTANTGGSSSNAPETPSSLNTVVAVGGTTLYLNQDATRSAETVWNENGAADQTGGNISRAMGATGGGCSTQVTAQLWQRSVANYGQTTCGTKRLAADISALADPYTGFDIYDSYQSSGWQTFGGTSLASPLVAALWGLAGGSGGVNYPSLSLYGHFKSDVTKSLYDVAAGGNGFCNAIPNAGCKVPFGAPNTFGAGILDCAFLAGSANASAGNRECDAATGYDGPSGVGTPVGLNAFKPLGPTAKVTVPATVTHGVNATFTGAPSTDPFPGGVISTYAWTFGDGTSSSAASPSVVHKYAAAGTKSLTLSVTDNFGRTGSTTVSVVVH